MRAPLVAPAQHTKHISACTATAWSSDFQPGFRETLGFREQLPRVPQLASKNNPTCEITPDNVLEILGIDFFCLKLRFYEFLFAQIYCVESFLLSVKFLAICILGLYYNVGLSFLCKTLFNSN